MMTRHALPIVLMPISNVSVGCVLPKKYSLAAPRLSMVMPDNRMSGFAT